MSYLVWPGHESFPLQKLVGARSHWSGISIVWKHLSPAAPSWSKLITKQNSPDTAKWSKPVLPLKEWVRKRFYQSVFNWIHSVKLCLLLGSTILQEVFVAGPTAHVHSVHSQAFFLWRDGRRQVWRYVGTGEGQSCKHLLFEQMSPLVNCCQCCLRVCYFYWLHVDAKQNLEQV